MHKGKIIQIIGPVVDVEFKEDTKLPALYNALKVERPHFVHGEDGTSRGENNFVILEVVKHLDATKVKAISMHSTDGLKRGEVVEDTGKMIEVPVGPEVLGNLFDVCGNVLGEAGESPTSPRLRGARITS